jgi:hypothetical protein
VDFAADHAGAGEVMPRRTVSVVEVAADQETDGRAYARVIYYMAAPDDPLQNEIYETYIFVTEDYGENWIQWDGMFPQSNTASLPLQIENTSVMLGSEILWTFPSAERRSFFNPDYDNPYNMYQRFKLPLEPSNALQGNTLYVALGTEGVLVGPAPNTSSTREWRITNSGIEPLMPLKLTLSIEDSVKRILWSIFLLPPIPLFHAYILVRIWSYLMPLKIAWKRAILVSLGLALVGSVGAIIFFTQIPVQLNHVVWICAAIVAVVSTSLT